MLIRIVKMTFAADKVNDFLAAFNARKQLIGTFKGCAGVELLQDTSDPHTFFTYSRWDHADSLENYRQSELFNTVWAIVKKWFIAKPEAWSVVTIEKAP